MENDLDSILERFEKRKDDIKSKHSDLNVTIDRKDMCGKKGRGERC